MPLPDKTAQEVLGNLTSYCYSFGFPKKCLSDNGKEFRNKKMEQFCEENGITLLHGTARTPTTQGLTERSNRSWKEDMRAIILEIAEKNIQRWCEYTNQAAYTRNIYYRTIIEVSSYEAVFGIKPHREILRASKRQAQNENDEGTDQSTAEHAGDMEPQQKRKKIKENQRKYNNDLIQQTKRKQEQKQLKFKILDMESLITPSRLYPCTATNVKLDFSSKASFTAACKKASGL